MRKVEIKPEKHDSGWIAVERVNNRIVWKSSNFAVEELAQERCNQRIALKEREAKRLGLAFIYIRLMKLSMLKKTRLSELQRHRLDPYRDMKIISS